MTCEPGCSCRGTDERYLPGSDCYTSEVRRQVRIVRDLPIDEVEAAKGRHPSQGGSPLLRLVGGFGGMTCQ